MGKKHKSFKKNKEQAYAYKEVVEKSYYFPEGTVPNQNIMLVGTDEFEHNNTSIDKNNQTIKKPFKYKLVDWLHDNYITMLVTIFIIAIIGFLFSHGKSIAIINYRLDNIESEITNLDSKVIQKDVLQLKLDNLKKETEHSFLLEIDNIQTQIEELDRALKDIKKE